MATTFNAQLNTSKKFSSAEYEYKTVEYPKDEEGRCSFCKKTDCVGAAKGLSRGYLGFGTHVIKSVKEEKEFSSASEALQHLIEKGRKDTKSFPIQFKDEDTLSQITGKLFLASELFSESAGRVSPRHEEESTFDDSDVHAMHPEYFNEIENLDREDEANDEEKELASFLRKKSCTNCYGKGCEECAHEDTDFDEDSLSSTYTPHESDYEEENEDTSLDHDSDNKVLCPECKGFSQHNKPEKAFYTKDHCPQCGTNHCGSDQTNRAPHCNGCEFPTICSGREKYQWNKKDSTGKTLTTTCPTCNNEGEITPGEDATARERMSTEESPTFNSSEPKKVKKQRNIVHDTSAEDFSDDGAGIVVQLKPKQVEHESGVSLSEAISKMPKRPDQKDPSPSLSTTTLTDHPKSCKCGGTGQVNDEEIARINSSDEYNNGIANIRRSVSDPDERHNQVVNFIKNQYACKGE